ncbi:hypothetical protein CF326_g2057 [Tilletia indica]|nr:hypothetical protein CF326_g2057 [Tilletia indica]
MLHILSPFILSDLACAGLKLVLAATQAGLTFTRLSTASSSGKPINQATAIVIPAIYGSCTIAQIVLCLALAGVHFVELRKGELSAGVWRLAKMLIWVVGGVTALTVLAGIVTIATNYTGSEHWYTDGSKAFNTPFTITFIIFMALSVIHLFVLFVYKRRVLSQGPRAKGRIGNDYEQVGATLSNSLRRANRVEASSNSDRDMTERLPMTGGADLATARRERSHSPAAYDPYHPDHARQTSGLRRQYSSAGYADYDEEEEEREGRFEGRGMYADGGPNRDSHYSSAGVQYPLSHAQQPSFGSLAAAHDAREDSRGVPSYPAFPAPSRTPQVSSHAGHQSQQASYASAEPDNFYNAHNGQEQADGLPVAQHHVAFQTPASVVPDYTGSIALPSYSEPGYTHTHNHTGSQAEAGGIHHHYSSYGNGQA